MLYATGIKIEIKPIYDKHTPLNNRTTIGDDHNVISLQGSYREKGYVSTEKTITLAYNHINHFDLAVRTEGEEDDKEDDDDDDNNDSDEDDDDDDDDDDDNNDSDEVDDGNTDQSLFATPIKKKT